MESVLNIKKYIDITSFPFPEIFKQGDLITPIKDLESFLNKTFAKGLVKPNYKKAKNVFIGKGTVICEGAVILGPAIIGENCVLGQASLLRGNCLLGNNVHLGHGVEIKNSIFLNNATAAHLNYVGDSIIGNNVNISGGTITANFRLDKKSVKLKFKNKAIDTKLLKFGAVIGDGSNIGVNSVLNPGTILAKKTIVYPLSSVTGVHKEGEIIKGIA